MDEHLDDLQMAALLAGEADVAAQRHLASCAACAAERERLAAAMGDWRGELQLGAERPAAFWERQRGAIAALRRNEQTNRVAAVGHAIAGVFGPSAASRWPSRMRWAVAAVAAALLAIVVGVALRPERPSAREAAAARTRSAAVSPNDKAGVAQNASDALTSPAADDALLVAVEGALARRAPEALAPAEALVHELDRSRPEGGES